MSSHKNPKTNLKKRQLAYKLKHDFFTVEHIVVVVALILCLLWTWRAITSMSRNWELEQRLTSHQKELTLLQLEVDTLGLENEYYKSEEYQELAARQKQNKKLPGETVIYLPANSESAKVKHRDEQESPVDTTPPSNFEQWLTFLFGA